mgnify:CR=1 FL=1
MSFLKYLRKLLFRTTAAETSHIVIVCTRSGTDNAHYQ